MFWQCCELDAVSVCSAHTGSGYWLCSGFRQHIFIWCRLTHPVGEAMAALPLAPQLTPQVNLRLIISALEYVKILTG